MRILENVFVSIVLRLFLGVLFIVAAYGKILNPGYFAHGVYNYKMLDPSVINLVAIYLPWVELVAGLALVVGVWKRGAAFLVSAMLGGFLFGIGFNWVQGRDIECTCFPAIELPVPPVVQSVLDFLLFSPDMVVTFWRDVMLLVIALMVLASPVVWRRPRAPRRTRQVAAGGGG